MNVYLFGFKGAGKTYFGSRLARKYSLPFLDTDALIEKQEGRPVREIVIQKGKSYFLEVEQKILSELTVERHIIALGGGALLDPKSVELLRSKGILIYLECPKALLKKRMLTLPLPTFLDSLAPEESFERMYSTRIKQYETISPYKVSLEAKTDEEVIVELWQVINSDRSFGSPRGENLMEKPLAL